MNYATKTNTKAENSLKEFYQGLPANKQKDFINKVCDECSVTLMTVYRWINTPTMVKAIYRDKIAEIAEKEVNEIFKFK